MYSSKLVDVFYTLSKSQTRALRKFVRSPYYNKRQDVIDLLNLLEKTPLENRIALRKANVSKKLYPKQKYQANKIDYVMSFLFKLIETFLVEQNYMSKATQWQIELMESYRNLGLDKHFQQALRQAKTLQEKSSLRDINYHELAFDIEFQHSLFLSAQERDATKNLQEVSNKLDLRFLSQKLKDACSLLAHQAVAKQQYDFGLLDSILPYVQDNPSFLEHPAIAVYYYYYQAANQAIDSELFFKKFKTTFLASTESFEHTELQDLYTMAINYCVRKVNIGQEEYQQEVFDFYAAGLELEILIDKGKLNPFKFNNITKLALRLDKIDWAANFIEKYKDLVDEQYQNTYVHNAYSMLYFAQGHYEKTMTRLQQVDYKELFITLDAKVLLLKVYYQLDEYDVLESFLNSFKVFLRRKDILAYHQEIYKNFIRMVQKLINLPPFNKNAKIKLRTEIESTQKLLEKKWLLEQLK